MVNALATRETISKMLDSLGTTVRVIPRTVSSTDKWGKKVYSVGSSSEIRAAPDNNQLFNRQGLVQGVKDNASLLLIAKGDADIGIDAIISYRSKFYRVLRIQKYPLTGIPIAKTVFLSECDFSEFGFPYTFPLLLS